jgi:ABC-2 type transport system ATP-binding protein
MSYTVTAEAISKAFGGHVVLDRVDISIEPGAVLALLGPNGAGKTTLVRILSTLVRPDAGRASVCGHDLLADPIGVRRSISLTGQFAAVDEFLTGEENLEMMARLRRLPRRVVRTRTKELLETFDLADARARRASTYSGGMRRRLDLAMSMVEAPGLLFLDEPTSGLDPHSREQLWQAVRGLTKSGTTVLLTTQYLEEADALADTVAVLDQGRLVAQGTAQQLKSTIGALVLRIEFDDAPAHERAVRLLTPARANGQSYLVDVVTDGSADHVYDTLRRLRAAGVHAARVSLLQPTLDDVFLTLTGAGVPPTTKEVA